MGQGTIWEMKNVARIIYRLCIAKCLTQKRCLKQTQYTLCVSWAPQNGWIHKIQPHARKLQTSPGGSFHQHHFFVSLLMIQNGSKRWILYSHVNKKTLWTKLEKQIFILENYLDLFLKVFKFIIKFYIFGITISILWI